MRINVFSSLSSYPSVFCIFIGGHIISTSRRLACTAILQCLSSHIPLCRSSYMCRAVLLSVSHVEIPEWEGTYSVFWLLQYSDNGMLRVWGSFGFGLFRIQLMAIFVIFCIFSWSWSRLGGIRSTSHGVSLQVLYWWGLLYGRARDYLFSQTWWKWGCPFRALVADMKCEVQQYQVIYEGQFCSAKREQYFNIQRWFSSATIWGWKRVQKGLQPKRRVLKLRVKDLVRAHMDNPASRLAQ